MVQYFDSIILSGVRSLGHERMSGTAGKTTSEGSDEDQQRPEGKTWIVPFFDLAVNDSALFTENPFVSNLLAKICICPEFSFGRRT